jgi:hypothetical protein
MAVVTIYRLAEECLKMLSGGDIQAATNISLNEMKISIGQVANSLLKIEHFQINEKMGERIPNGSVLGLYEGIVPTSWVTGRSRATLPIKPLKLPRNMGIFSVYRTDDPNNEFIPLQMGQSNLIRGQAMINNLLGQTGYEPLGAMDIAFTKDLPLLYPGETLSARLAIMDISQYSDYDPLPVLPEQEWQIKQEVVKLYGGVGIADKIVDATTKQQQNIPLKDQQQT